MSPKCKKFLKALEKLCREHEVQLTASMYDSLQVWDLDGEDPLVFAGIDDRTKEPPAGVSN